MTENEISVEIQSGYDADKGKGIARLDANSMNRLDLSSGDIIEIQGKKRTYSRCLRRPDKDYVQSVLNIDGLIRSNAGVKKGDRIYIKKILSAKVAEKITISPLEIMPLVEELDIKNSLMDVPITEEDNIVFENFNGPLFFRVIQKAPLTRVVVVTPKTVVQVEEYLFLEESRDSDDSQDYTSKERYPDGGITSEEFNQLKEEFED